MNQYIKKLILEAFDFNGYLNRYLNNQGEDLPDEILKTNAPIIYAFTTPKVPDAIKIGYTDLGAWKRIEQWKRIYGDDINLLGYWTSKSLNQLLKYVFFKDHPVHKKVINKGHYNLMPEDFEKLKVLQNLLELHVSREFFRKINDKTHNDKDTLSKEIIEEIIRLMKEEIRAGNVNFTLYTLLDDGTTRYADEIIQEIHDYSPTPLQQDCIDKGIKAIKDGKTDLLMAAVMRFGKTYAAYKIIAGLGDKEKMQRLKYVVVVTAKADTRTAWRNDISHKDFIDKFVFIEFDGKTSYLVSEMKSDGKIHTSSELTPNMIEIKLKENDGPDGKTVIVFATLLDLKGNPTKLSKGQKEDIDFNSAVNTIKDKHKFLFNSHPDIMVIDETHYGTHSLTLGQITGFSEDNSDLKQLLKDAADMQLYITSIDAKVKLQCSGTPYYILASGEFSKFYDNKEIISDVSYSDMLKARDEWVKDNPDKDETTSPYYGIPNIYKFGLKLTDSCIKILKENDWESKMSTLFALKNKGKNANPYESEFIHEDAIIDLMVSLYGNKTNNQIGFINTDKIRDGEIFKHTMILLPKINACFALEKLLNEKIIDKSKREVIRLVMPKSTGYKGDIKDSDTVNAKLNALEKAGKQSIILTVDRMLTGVTLPLVDSMIFMKDTRLPQDYDLAIFRMCSRNIGSAQDDEGNKIKINRKNNVYLIDFNIARMFKMTLDSAAAMAAAKGETGALAIEKYVLDNIDTIPTFTDDKDSIFDDETHRNNILSHIHSVNVHDLLKEYINYNKNRSIEDGIKDKSKNFKHFMSDSSTIDILRNFSDAKLGGNNGPKLDPGTDDIQLDPKKGIGGKAKGKNNNNNQGNSTETETEDYNKPELDKINERFGNMMKSILYSIICFDKPVKDMNDLLDTIKNNSACKQIISDFLLSEELLSTIYDSMSNLEKNELDFMIYQIYLMMNDKSLKPIELVTNCINKLGKIDSSEVVTPPELVDKMINKIDIKDFKKAKSILLVNEKCCEFFMGIYNNKQLGPEVAKKCKIVPSSIMTVNFIKKILKQLRISDNIILDIKDLNNNGKLIDDFLIMDNLKIGKFDICLMNPPYEKNMHLKFIRKILKIADNIINISPVRWLQDPFAMDKRSTLKQFEDVAKHIKNIDVSKNDKENFDIIIYSDLGIYTLTKEETNFDYNNIWKLFKTDTLISIINKICFCNDKHIGNVVEKNKNDGIRVLIANIGGNRGALPTYKDIAYAIDGKVNGIDWTKKKSDGGYEKTEGSKIPHSIKFETINEAQNFYDSYQKFEPLKGLCKLVIQQLNIPLNFLPFFNDYTRPITEEFFKKHYDLTDDEMNELIRLGKMSYKESI